MVDIVLLVGKILFLALLYLFLLAAVRAGIGLVRSGAPVRDSRFIVAVTHGPAELAGTRLPLSAPVNIGRSPKADIVIGDSFVSTMHARISPTRDGARVEDLGSTNGTLLNGRRLTSPENAGDGDIITIGQVQLMLEKT